MPSFLWVWLSVLGISIILAVAYAYTLVKIEAFEDAQEEEIERQMQNALTKVSELLCPPQEYIQEDNSKAMTGAPVEKSKKSLMFMMRDATRFRGPFPTPKFSGVLPLFPCPVPSESNRIPANIGQRLQNSLQYLTAKINYASQKVNAAIQCQERKEEEPAPDPADETTAAPELPKLKIPTEPTERNAYFETRLNQLNQFLNNPDAMKTVQNMKALYEDLMIKKGKIERNEIKISCNR